MHCCTMNVLHYQQLSSKLLKVMEYVWSKAVPKMVSISACGPRGQDQMWSSDIIHSVE